MSRLGRALDSSSLSTFSSSLILLNRDDLCRSLEQMHAIVGGLVLFIATGLVARHIGAEKEALHGIRTTSRRPSKDVDALGREVDAWMGLVRFLDQANLLGLA